ncbi:MAG: InlB B-repeat-containing protein [Treponema sp.]|nr:InlB B-repeat-containing protein [Treponema sp.]
MKNAFGFALIALAAGLFAAGCEDPTKRQDYQVRWVVNFHDASGERLFPSESVIDGGTLSALPTLAELPGQTSLGWHTHRIDHSEFDPKTPITSHMTLIGKYLADYVPPITWGALPNGDSENDTSEIVFTFSAGISTFTRTHIVISDVDLIIGTLTPNENRTIWTLAVTPSEAGRAQIRIFMPGISASPVESYIYFTPPPIDPDPPPTPPAIYTVTFDAQSGILSGTSAFVREDGQTIASTPGATLPTTTRYGFFFREWWTDKTDGVQFTADTPITADMTIYARWEAEEGGKVWLPLPPGQTGFPSGGTGIAATEGEVINSAAYGDGVFVAVGNNGNMARSEDGGFTWITIDRATPAYPDRGSTFQTGQNINDIAYGNGWFIAAGTNGKIARSEDGGKTWKGANIGIHVRTINGIAYGEVDGKGVFIAVGAEGRMARSENNGETWTGINAGLSGNVNQPAATSQFNAGHTIHGIASNDGSVFVAVGNNGRMARSTDGGKNWYQIPPGQTGSQFSDVPANSPLGAIQGIAYGDGTFIAVGGMGRMARNSDKDAAGRWTMTHADQSGFQGGPSGEQVLGIAYGDGWFVAVGNRGGMSRSSNKGAAWSFIPPSADAGAQGRGEGSGFLARQTIHGITYGEGKFLAVGQNSRMSLNQME